MSGILKGIDQNVTNVSSLITRIGLFPNGYNPSRNEFTIPFLVQLKIGGEAVIASANAAKNVLQKMIALRISEFTGFGSLITRSVGALRISGALPKVIEQGEAIVREIRGERASNKHTEEEIAAAKEKGEDLKNNTQHNADFDSKVKNLGNYVTFLRTVDEYRPNEPDLTVDALAAKYQSLKTANDNCSTAESTEKAVRLVRDNYMNDENTGLVDIALGVKSYVKSAYGATSAQYKSISDLLFVKIK
jgi:hypothetical protein